MLAQPFRKILLRKATDFEQKSAGRTAVSCVQTSEWGRQNCRPSVSLHRLTCWSKIYTPNKALREALDLDTQSVSQFPDDENRDSRQNAVQSPLNCPTPVLAPVNFTDYWSKALTAVRIVSSTGTSVTQLAATARQHQRQVINTRYDVNLVKVFSSHNIGIIRN